MNYLIVTFWCLAIICFLIIQEDNQKKLRSNAKRFYKLVSNFDKSSEMKEIDKIMRNAGIPINIRNFQITRYTFLSLFLILILITGIKGGESLNGGLIIVLLIFLISAPRQKIFGKPTPFQMLIDLFLMQKRDKYNQELYMAISQLKNTFVVKKEAPPSSDLIIEQVRRYTTYTREIFNQMLSYWMIGEKEVAIHYFESSIGTKEAQNLGQVFLKLDDLNPSEMYQQLEAYQEIYRAEKQTKKLKLNEHKSNILFIFIIACTLSVMFNFVIVAFFIDFLNDINSLL